jgi:hypothetical protein
VVAPRVQQVDRLAPGHGWRLPSTLTPTPTRHPRGDALVGRPILDDRGKAPLPALRVRLLRRLVDVDGDAQQAGQDEELDLAPPKGGGLEALAVGGDAPLGQFD